MEWLPFDNKTFPMPTVPWDGKSFVALRYEPRHAADSGQVEAVTSMYAWNVLQGFQERQATHFVLLPKI